MNRLATFRRLISPSLRPHRERLMRILLLLLAIGASFMHPANSQSLIILHNFGDGSVLSDGFEPDASVTLGNDGNFYGTTERGGSRGYGTVFKITPGGAVSILHNFGDGSVQNDGAYPGETALVQGADGYFYGATGGGGSASEGTVFKMSLAGMITILHNFGDGSVQNDGTNPYGGLVQGIDGTLYGTTQYGGSTASDHNNGDGTLFKITPSGTEIVLHNFGDGSVSHDGINPASTLVQDSSGNIYGTTGPGSGYAGTIFKITPTGTFTILHSFGDGSVLHDGENPDAGLVLGNDGNFYGTTAIGGTAGDGTLFKITSSGTETILHNFGDGSTSHEGSGPEGILQDADGSFYGTTIEGGTTGYGTVFKITSSGAATVLHNFGDGTVPNDGINPFASLVKDTAGNFYGTTFNGGSAGIGTVFRLSPTIAQVPAITSFTPASGAATTVVTITGADFTGASSVKFNGTAATAFTVNSATQITATVPSGATTGTITVTTTGGTATSTQTFTVLLPPTITAITPMAGPVGTIVTITGTNFADVSRVRFHNASATTYTVNSPARITVTVPIGAATGTITVNEVGTGVTSSQVFTVTVPPTITSFTPTSGPVGTVVTITGTNFTEATTVKFNGVSAAFTVTSATGIAATVPAGAATGPISVTTPGGTATSSQIFTVTASPPTITSISPPSATAGTLVTITGTNLAGATSVTVGGVAVPFTVVNATTITFTIPPGLAGGTIVVTTPAGTVTSTVPLVVLTWTAGAVGAAQSGTGRILWNRSDGAAGLWALSASDTQTAVGPTYGPSPGWSAAALATASDGTSRVLWVNANGSAGVWTLNAAGVATTEGPTYASPGSGWTAKSVGVAGDGTSRVLWTTATGSMQVWSFGVSDAQTVTGPTYGPISGWSAQSLSTAPDGTSRVLWDRSDGAAGVWSLGVNDVQNVVGPVYGPYSGWTAKSIGASGDGTSRVLWANVNGDAGVWSLSASDVETVVGAAYGPYPGWTAGSLATGVDGTSRVLWNRSDRSAGVWSFGVNDTRSVVGPTYGPY